GLPARQLAPGAETDAASGGAARQRDDEIRPEALDLLRDARLRAGPHANHRDDRGNTDDDAEHREGAPQLVDAQRADGDADALPDAHAASSSAGSAARTRAASRGDATRPGAGPALASGHTGVEQRQLDVLEGARPGQEVELLEDEADLCVPDPRERVRREAGDVLAVDDVPTGGGRVETAEEVHEGGLAGTRWPHHRDELAGLDGDGNAAEGVDGVRPEVVVLRQAVDGDDRSGHG